MLCKPWKSTQKRETKTFKGVQGPALFLGILQSIAIDSHGFFSSSNFALQGIFFLQERMTHEMALLDLP